MNHSNNILLENFDTIPFSKIKNEDYKIAIKELINWQKKEIDSIITNNDTPNFKNTIEALENSGEQLNRVAVLFSNINSAETNESLQKIAKEINPLLTELSNDIMLNTSLFNRIKNVYDKRFQISLSVEEKTLLNNTYKNFSRNGANLNDSEKYTLRNIDKELSLLTLKFNENLLAETNNYEIHITDEKDLLGVPNGAREASSILAKEKGKKGWLINMQIPSFLPFLKYSENRDLRKKIKLSYESRCFLNSNFNNEENVLKISKLRYQRAQLLGYATHADFVLEESMAKNPSKVLSFLNELLDKAMPYAKKEVEMIESFAKELDNIKKLESWDVDYYSEKLRSKLFNLNDEILRPYFKLDNVILGAFHVAKKLFGLSFNEVENIDIYHNDVRTFEVINESNEFIAIFYVDFFPREGKQGGAWMTSFKSQKIVNDKNIRPHISNVCNFTKPTNSKPSLLTFNEVTTLFHEFGHGLHGMLANTVYCSLSGTSVYRDFVELPSQIMENWCYERECLEIFAKHYETGENIPIEYINKIIESSTFLQGMHTIRQLYLGFLDMSWHSLDPTSIDSVKKHETKSVQKTQILPDNKEICTSVSFGHLFSDPYGYSSGYYSYKWSEVLDADAFESFKENGIFNKKIGESLMKNILSTGGTENPMDLYIRFKGKEPSIEPLLKRSGLIEKVIL